MKRDIILYKLDKEGFFLDYESKEIEVNTEEGITDIKNIPEGYASFGWMQQNPKQRWFKPKFVNGKWVESLTQEEIQEHDKKIEQENNIKPKEEMEQFKIQIEELQRSNAELMNLITMQSMMPTVK